MRRFREAEATFQTALAAARSEGHVKNIGRFLVNLGGAQLYQWKYSQAFDSFQQARQYAHEHGLVEYEAGAWLNLGSLYAALGAGDASEQALEAATRIMPPSSVAMPVLRAQRVQMKVRRGDYQSALAEWDLAMQAAQAAMNWQVEQLLWEALGKIRTARREFSLAEEALANHYRIITLHHIPANRSFYQSMGRLRMAQGRPVEAVSWMAKAERDSARSAALLPWGLAQDRAMALANAGRQKEALEEYRRAWSIARNWRQDVLPASTFDLAADVSVAELASTYACYLMSSEKAGWAESRLVEAWAMVEQSRAVGLRRQTLQREETLARISPEYPQLLATRRNAGSGASEASAAELEARLAELETRAGIATTSQAGLGPIAPGELLRNLQAKLKTGDVVFTLLAGEPASYLWAVTSRQVAVTRLPGKGTLKRSVQLFLQDMRAGTKPPGDAAYRLYTTLFGGLPPAMLQAEHWIFSQDEILFEVPVAALQTAPPPHARYVVESHILQSVPSALWMLHPSQSNPSRSLLAIGDAIHNGADPRYQPSRRTTAPLSFWIWPFRSTPRLAENTVELPSLPGSRQEIRSISSIWQNGGRPAEMVSGRGATAERVGQAMQRTPAVIHFATHVIPAAESRHRFLLEIRAGKDAVPFALAATAPGDQFLTLSINQEGVREGISSSVLASYHVPGALVVLNGCSSGTGIAQKGAGLSGFTSSWLAAGARSVVASLWPVEDGRGEFFETFYRSLLRDNSPARALRNAQLAALHNGSWRSQPRYWATYFTIGKD
ncbi:MAG: CHAT domain-containing protein [Acidobacteria bacterium]|nr:CHAT domain-containing protein [Acidobacteriota bacterium]